VKENNVEKVWIEEYAFSKKESRSHALGELGGAVKLRLFLAGINFGVVHSNSARARIGRFSAERRPKDENGKRAKRTKPGVKEQVQAALHAMGAPKDWTGDELDAFVVANHGLIVGGHGGILVPEETKKQKKARAA
jgi:hypothetical protein